MKTKAKVIQRLLDEKLIDNEELILLLENHIQFVPQPYYVPYNPYPYYPIGPIWVGSPTHPNTPIYQTICRHEVL